MPATHERAEQQRDAVAVACHRHAGEGLLIGTAGKVSVRDGDRIAVTATGTVLGTCTPEQVTVVGSDGGTLAGNLEATSELELHLGIYQRYSPGAVVHTHSPQATALSLVLDALPCVHYQQLLLGGSVRVAPFGVFGTPEPAEHVLAALEGRSAALTANHGALTFGPTLAQTVENALLLEWLCGLYLRAAQIGTPRILDDNQHTALLTAASRRGYGTTRPTAKDSTRRARGSSPSVPTSSTCRSGPSKAFPKARARPWSTRPGSARRARLPVPR